MSGRSLQRKVAPMWRWVILSSALWMACGAAAPRPPTPSEQVSQSDCAELARRAEAALVVLESCRAQHPTPPWAEREVFEWLEARLDSQLERAAEAASEEDAEEEEASSLGIVALQEIAEHVWALLDGLPDSARDPALMTRIENASEQLLRPHDPEERDRTLAELAGALGVLRDRLEPSPMSSACDAEGRASAEAWVHLEALCSVHSLEMN